MTTPRVAVIEGVFRSSTQSTRQVEGSLTRTSIRSRIEART